MTPTTDAERSPMDVIPQIEVEGRTIPHNAVTWCVATNRHPETSGRAWGWIEGAPGNECWSDNKRFDRVAAGEACRLHNKWLEDQKPLSIKLIEARERLEKSLTNFNHIEAAYQKAKAELEKCDTEIKSLNQEPRT